MTQCVSPDCWVPRAALAILLAFALGVAAQEPGRLPDRIVLTWRKDPTRTQAITWRTDTSVTRGLAECEEVNGGPAERKQAVAVTTRFKSDLGEAHFHSAHFEGLTPNTEYAYRVGDGATWSDWGRFRTASDKSDRFSFLYFGDAQYQLKEKWGPLVRAAFQAAPHARFSLHAGDLVNAGGRDAEWGEWFQAALPIHRTMPVLPTPGNHEYMNDRGGLPGYWSKQFALPDNGPAGVGGAFYLDFQGVRFVCLNTNEKLTEQVEWLHAVLGKNSKRWTVVAFHHPVYSAASGRDDPELRKTLQPVFDRYRVDLVLQGHDHCYGRSDLLGYQDARGSTVYVVSVSGPQFYPVNGEKWMSRWGQNLQFFQVVTIDGDTLHFEARTLEGDLYDSFTLHKQADGPNLLINGPHDPRSVQPPPASQSGPGGVTSETPKTWLHVALLLVLSGILLALRFARRRRTVTKT